jgi:uncharacterized protein
MKNVFVTPALFAALCGACSGTPAASSSSKPDVSVDAAPPLQCFEAATEEVSVQNAFGTLSATLEVPAHCGPVPVVLLIPGSGAGDRNGNDARGKGANMYAQLAKGLLEKGIASLRYDKAGIGKSTKAFPKSEENFLFEMGADDAAKFLPPLRADARFLRVVLVGHSEGSQLGMLVAAKEKLDGFVSLAGGGRPIAETLRRQLTKQVTDPVLLEQSLAIIAKLEAGERVAEVPSELMGLFRPSVQPYLITWMKHDPARDIKLVNAPVVIVQGTTDIQVEVNDAQLLSAARPDAQLALIDGMSHVLKVSVREWT